MPPIWVWKFLDILLYIFHLLIIAINVFGWISPRFRPVQRIVLLLTTISWLGLGLYFGIGYCFLTDWHWDIKRHLGETHIPPSFIQYVLREQLGLSFSDSLVDFGTAAVFVLILVISLGQIIWEKRQNRSR